MAISHKVLMFKNSDAIYIPSPFNICFFCGWWPFPFLAAPAVSAASTATAAADSAAAATAAAADSMLLLKQLYNICRVPGFEPEYLRPQTGVLPMSHTHPWFANIQWPLFTDMHRFRVKSEFHQHLCNVHALALNRKLVKPVFIHAECAKI